MFNKDQFIEDCKAALKESDPQNVVDELVTRSMRHPEHVISELGEPKLAGVETIYVDDELTILNLVWGPHMTLHPHDHRMWAVIGIYGGREENIFYRRSEEGLTRHGTKILDEKDVVPLGESIIHEVHNPMPKLTGAIHVYGGNFFEAPRSEWDPETHEEHPYDIEHTMQVFEASNQRLRAD